MSAVDWEHYYLCLSGSGSTTNNLCLDFNYFIGEWSKSVYTGLTGINAMARVFGHTLMELLDLRPDPKERDLIEAYRKIRPEARALAVQVLEQMSPPTAERGRTRKRTDE